MSAAVQHPLRPVLPIRPEAEFVPPSGIGEVAGYGRTKPDVIPLWIGEGDAPTPSLIREAAKASLDRGETFYTWQRGLNELRDAIARYHDRVYGGTFDRERFSVTAGGMHAAQIAARIVSGPGDEVIVPTPAWANVGAALQVAGAHVVQVPMSVTQAGWHVDPDRIRAAITPRTRAICINSPSNPTGWTATRDDLVAILDLARAHGLWIIADEIYGRFVHDTADARAPSFHDIMDPAERIIFIQTFSKNWAMTGWRIGWIEAPAEFGAMIASLIQVSTTGVAPFLQHGALAALEQGEPIVESLIAASRRGRAIVCDGLAETGLVALPRPPGAFYAFFSVPGVTDTRRLAFDLIDTARVGVAPGSAFGPGGEQHMRLCFLRRAADLEEAVARLAATLPGLLARQAA